MYWLLNTFYHLSILYGGECPCATHWSSSKSLDRLKISKKYQVSATVHKNKDAWRRAIVEEEIT